MRRLWREIVIELTPEQEPVWEQALSKFWLHRAGEYYECPISPPEKGKARLPYDPDIILEMVIQLQQLGNADEKIWKEISRKLARLYWDGKMIYVS